MLCTGTLFNRYMYLMTGTSCFTEQVVVEFYNIPKKSHKRLTNALLVYAGLWGTGLWGAQKKPYIAEMVHTHPHKNEWGLPCAAA